jgi:hypothetical protein
MGWDFTKGQTKMGIVRELVAADSSREVLQWHLAGRELWTLERWTSDGVVTISVHLLEKQEGYGWGSKSMSESMGPFYYGCPPEYLDLAPVGSKAWRERLLAHQGR